MIVQLVRRIRFIVVAWLMLLPCGQAFGIDISAPSQQAIDLAIGQGRLLQFDQPVEAVFLADPTIADVKVVSPEVVFVYGTKLGTTNLIATSADKAIKASLQLRVIADAKPANDAKARLQPNSTVRISLFGNRVVATGRTRTTHEAIDMGAVADTFSPSGMPPLNDTTIATSQQVNLRVRFAEVSRTDLMALGLDWQAAVNAGGFSLGLSRKGASGTGSGLAASLQVGAVNINALIDALAQKGIVTVLAEPNLTAVTGQTASFLAGGEIPVPVPQDNGRTTIDYKPFGVSLLFTPTLLPGDRIALRVRPEVSALSASGSIKIEGFDVPALTVRRADTVVEVASGQTFAIAGLFQRELTHSADQFPVLGDVPIIGALFRSSRFKRNETELVILITPYLVAPSSTHTLATPLDRPADGTAQVEGGAVGFIVK
ncbi:type II and III secretion system protein family protein [Chelatococcus sp. GCM10030263]|uniref:type II and III secretion system protein family protein n=1 Tax=Chelatococcus sp. GCM10030263 TaxID=3273387 RepID=UPI00360C19ED